MPVDRTFELHIQIALLNHTFKLHFLIAFFYCTFLIVFFNHALHETNPLGLQMCASPILHLGVF